MKTPCLLIPLSFLFSYILRRVRKITENTSFQLMVKNFATSELEVPVRITKQVGKPRPGETNGLVQGHTVRGAQVTEHLVGVVSPLPHISPMS